MAGKVLYVDDDRNLCQIVAKALRGEGYTVRTAFDGDEAIQQIQEEVPGLLLLDVLLPRRDGFAVLAGIRELGGVAGDLPCVLLSGCTPTPSYTERARKLGALELLAKPVPLDKIFEVVTRHLGEAKGAAPRLTGSRAASARRSSGDRHSIGGTLDRIPFPAILHNLHGLRASGVLQLKHEKKRKWIEFRDGYPVSVHSNLVRETLGHLLVRTGRITRAMLDESRRHMEENDRRQGEILVAMEVLSEEDVGAALRDQADEKLFEIFSWPAGRFKFERGAKLQKGNAVGLGRSPANLILRGVRTHFPIERVDRYIALQGQRSVSRGESPFYRFQEINVGRDEEALLRGLDGSQPLSVFAGEEESLRRTIYGLLACGLLELTDPREGAARRGRRSSAPPERVRGVRADQADEDREREDPRFAELSELAAQLRAGTYFEVLGVETTATDHEVRSAYERLSGRTHPDRFKSSGQAVRDLAAEIFDLLRDAYETLADPRCRQEYVLQQRRAEREADQRGQAELALQAETEFRRGGTALKSRDYEGALAHFGRALELYPDEGDHHAHYGWALYLCHPGDPSIVTEALEHVRRGLKLASHREKPYLFMGRLYKAIGRADVAEKMFTRAVQIQPECVEALRELRLINMRRERSKGIIGRLLRR
jgi:CheY-like chemotaxis protein/tetratricopeptide (TPR) repeat protein